MSKLLYNFIDNIQDAKTTKEQIGRLHQVYLDTGWSIQALAKEFGVEPRTVATLFDRYGYWERKNE